MTSAIDILIKLGTIITNKNEEAYAALIDLCIPLQDHEWLCIKQLPNQSCNGKTIEKHLQELLKTNDPVTKLMLRTQIKTLKPHLNKKQKTATILNSFKLKLLVLQQTRPHQ